jgi:hypothetical protein
MDDRMEPPLRNKRIADMKNRFKKQVYNTKHVRVQQEMKKAFKTHAKLSDRHPAI